MSSTDALNAERILVDDRIYRLLPIKDSLKISEEEKYFRKPCLYDADGDGNDDDLPITHQGDKFIATIYVPESVMGFIVGTKHANLAPLKTRYNVKINTPARRNIEAGITIQGTTKTGVATTYKYIQNRLNHARLDKTDPTHFISFPINSSNIQDSFLKFKDEVLTKYKRVRGIDASLFPKPTKLHLTVTLLTLLDGRDKENAIAILNKCRDSFFKELGEKEIVVQVQGLDVMNDDEAEAGVLYAQIHELDGDNRLQILADKIMKEFKDAYFSKDKHEKVKIHITLMNTTYRANLEDENSQHCTTFDARKIMNDYKDYNFGQITISEIHISTRYTEAADGFYNCIYKMKLKS